MPRPLSRFEIKVWAPIPAKKQIYDKTKKAVFVTKYSFFLFLLQFISVAECFADFLTECDIVVIYGVVSNRREF